MRCISESASRPRLPTRVRVAWSDGSSLTFAADAAAAWVWTTISETLWATTSCNSRAIRTRSSTARAAVELALVPSRGPAP